MKIRNLLAVSLIATTLFATGCKEEEPLTYNDFEDLHIDLGDLYNKEGKYGVFLYQTNCSHCHTIEDTVTKYVKKVEKKKAKMDAFYFVLMDNFSTRVFKDEDIENMKRVHEVTAEMIANKVSKLEDTYFVGTPTLYVINDGILGNMLVGSGDISKYLALN